MSNLKGKKSYKKITKYSSLAIVVFLFSLIAGIIIVQYQETRPSSEGHQSQIEESVPDLPVIEEEADTQTGTTDVVLSFDSINLS